MANAPLIGGFLSSGHKRLRRWALLLAVPAFAKALLWALGSSRRRARSATGAPAGETSARRLPDASKASVQRGASDKRSWISGLLVAAVALFGAAAVVFLLLARPADEARLYDAVATPGSVTAVQGASPEKRPVLQARLRWFSTQPEQQVAGNASRRLLRLVLPVHPSDCRRLIAVVGGSCAGRGAPFRGGSGGLAIHWPAAARVAVTSKTPFAFRVRWPPASEVPRPITTWNMSFTSLVTTVRFHCLENRSFHLIGAEVRLRPVRCVVQGARLRVLMPVDPDALPNVALGAVDYLNADMTAKMVVGRFDRGALAVGDVDRALAGGVAARIDSGANAGVRFRMAVKDETSFPRLAANAAKAVSVASGGKQRIRTRFDRHQAIIGVGGVAVSALLSIWWGRKRGPLRRVS